MEKLKTWWLQHPKLWPLIETIVLLLVVILPFVPFTVELVRHSGTLLDGTEVVETAPLETEPLPDVLSTVEPTEKPQRLQYYYESLFDDDEEMRNYYQKWIPEAVLPTDSWTVDEVLQLYYDDLERWHLGWETAGDFRFYAIWSRDYKYCFTVDYESIDFEDDYYIRPIEERSGWLRVNGVKVAAIDRKTYPMDPTEVVKAYQSGEWDGRGCLRSHDWSTTVRIEDGWLSYVYKTSTYTEVEDPEGMAYKGYAEQPWWETEQIEQYPEASEPYANQFYSGLKVRLYVDLPLEGQAEILKGVFVTSYVQPSRYESEARHGIYLMREDGVDFYQDGRLIDWWKLAADKSAACFIILTRDYYHWTASDYVYTRESIVELKPCAEPEVVLEDIVWASDPFMSPSTFEAFGLTDGTLSYWRCRLMMEGLKQDGGVLLQNVRRVSPGDYSAGWSDILVECDDGTYLVRASAEVAAEYLGSEPFDYYVLRWRNHLYE